MSGFVTVKLGLAAIGVILFGYGISSDNITIRWLGIGFLAASVLMRFLPKRLRSGDYPRTPPTQS